MIKTSVAGFGKAIFTLLIFAYVIFAFVYDERMAAKLAEILKPSSAELIPVALSVGLVAMPLLYLNFRTRFYAGIGFGLCGFYLLTLTWLECLYWSQQFLNNFFFNAFNIIPFLGCLIASIIGLAVKAKWVELGFIIVTTVISASCLGLCIKIVETEDLKEASPSAPPSYSFAMGLVWLKVSIWITFMLSIIPMLLKLEDDAGRLATILSVSACYLFLLGLGLAHRWKIALPFALMSECSMAYAAYEQATTADWHDIMAAFGASVVLILSAVGIVSMLTLLTPANLSYYLRPGDER